MYSYYLTKHADRNLRKLPLSVQKRIIEKFRFYLNTDDPLHYADTISGEQSQVYRIRVGDYRVIFDLIDHNIRVLKIKPRTKAY